MSPIQLNSSERSNIIALDSDSVITDYVGVVPRVWQAAFGKELKVVNPGYFHANHVYDFDMDDPEISRMYYKTFDARFWGDMDLLPGVQEACAILVEKRYRLVCVSSMPKRFEQARQDNFARYSLPIERVIAAPPRKGVVNPKLETLQELAPVAFVDDLLSNFLGLPGSIHRAWLEGWHPDSPNHEHLASGVKKQPFDTSHSSLLDFAKRMPAFQA